jgi:hypothetical protein
MSEDKKHWPLGPIGLYLVLAGLVLVFASLYFEPAYEQGGSHRDYGSAAPEHFETKSASGAENEPPVREEADGKDESRKRRLILTLIRLLEKLGLALIVVGIVDLVVHLRAVNQHFMDRIRDLVIQDSYLSRLKPEALTELMNRAFVAQVGNPGVDIDGEGSFLRFFHSDLKGFIGKPYRERATSEIICLGVEGDYVHIRDVLSYTCRTAGNSIQDKVRWVNDPDEAEDVKSVSISVQTPGSGTDSRRIIADQSRFRYKYEGDDKLHVEKLPDKPPRYYVIEESLADYLSADGLVVTIEAEYTIKAERFQYWQMTNLTRGIGLILKFPPHLKVQVVSFVQDDSKCNTFDAEGYYRLNYPYWVFPDTGLCWKFLRT